MRVILMFHNCEEQSHMTVSTDHYLIEEKEEPKWIQAEVPLLASLMPYPEAKPQGGGGGGGRMERNRFLYPVNHEC